MFLVFDFTDDPEDIKSWDSKGKDKWCVTHDCPY